MEECYARGKFEIQHEIDGRGGVKEQAIAAMARDDESDSHFVVFFTDELCTPDKRILDADLQDGCMSRLKVVPTNYKSWMVYDMCPPGQTGCTLAEKEPE